VGAVIVIIVQFKAESGALQAGPLIVSDRSPRSAEVSDLLGALQEKLGHFVPRFLGSPQ
jgi:hypothetical protein